MCLACNMPLKAPAGYVKYVPSPFKTHLLVTFIFANSAVKSPHRLEDLMMPKKLSETFGENPT